MKSILIISDYFGSWPAWFPLYIQSCAANPTVNWLINTDCEIPATLPKNVEMRFISRIDYIARVSNALGINFNPSEMYSIVNLRPAFALIYAEDIKNYDYYGWADIDVIFGNIRKFYNQWVMSHNIISSARGICSGHLTFLKNTASLNSLLRIMPYWRERLEDPSPCPWSESLDEACLSAFVSPKSIVRQLLGEDGDDYREKLRLWRGNYFKEQWTTPFVPGVWRDGKRLHPEVWYWSDGRIFDNRGYEYLYLHLMNFRYRRYVNNELYGMSKTWDGNTRKASFEFSGSYNYVQIDRNGIRSISSEEFNRGKICKHSTKPKHKAPYGIHDLLSWAKDNGAEFWLEGSEVRLSDPDCNLGCFARTRLWNNHIAVSEML